MNSDINYIIRMSLNGDKKYQEILLEELRPLLYKNIFMYWNPMQEITKDLFQEGCALILESLLNFDESMNVHFLQFIKIKVIYFYKNYYRDTNNERNELCVTDYLSLNCSQNNIDDIFVEEQKKQLLININKLKKSEQEILYLYYFEHQPMTEISKNLNIPYRTVLGRKQTAIKKLKKLMDKWK